MIKQAVFAGGCFWGMEAKFKHIQGVVNTMVGYTGGHTENPNYRDVCRDLTGHAEAIQVDYDPEIISYNDLLEAFFNFHDPTLCESNSRSFASQYRSAIAVANEKSVKLPNVIFFLSHSGDHECKIITEIVKRCFCRLRCLDYTRSTGSLTDECGYDLRLRIKVIILV